MQSQKFHGRIFGDAAKCACRMDVQMKSTNFKSSDCIFFLPFPHILKTVCDRNGAYASDKASSRYTKRWDDA